MNKFEKLLKDLMNIAFDSMDIKANLSLEKLRTNKNFDKELAILDDLINNTTTTIEQIKRLID